MRPSRNRAELEELWRLKLEQAAERHKLASEKFQETLNEMRGDRST
jgi:hypothetical protein